MCRLFPAMLSVLGVLALAPGAVLGQGTFIFGNRPSVIGGVGAPVGWMGDPRPGSPLGGATARVAGNAFLAQPIVNGVPLEPIVPFGTGAAAGFIVSQIVVLPDVPPGVTVQVQMAAWVADLGPTFRDAVALGIGYAALSNTVLVTLSQPIDPNQAPMIGLSGFLLPGIPGGPINPDIPEPSAPVLAIAGFCVLLALRL